MTIRSFVLAGITIAFVVGVAVVATWKAADAHPDQNDDGFVSVADIAAVVHAFGQTLPPTPTPTPGPGGGYERILAANVFVPDGGPTTDLGAFNPNQCRNATVYVSAKLDPGQTPPGVFDLYVRPDQDGLPDVPAPAQSAFINENMPAGDGVWRHYAVAHGTAGSGRGLGYSVGQPSNGWPTPWAMIGVRPAASIHYKAEVHCAPATE